MRIIISFGTITDAMMVEAFSKNGDLNGKLIPIPNEISAGCGLAWECTYNSREEIESILLENALEFYETHYL